VLFLSSFAGFPPMKRGREMSSTLTATRPALSLRWMIRADLPELARIEKQAAAPRWELEHFEAAYRGANTIGRVAEVNGRIIGFAVYTILRRPVPLDDALDSLVRLRDLRAGRYPDELVPESVEVELRNLGVDPDWQRQGVGRALVEELDKKLRRPGDCIVAQVPETNLAVQLLLRELGFTAVGVLRDHFEDEDAYLMERRSRATSLGPAA
jgi:ribosomal-protein-alanine N-acetyltransferase